MERESRLRKSLRTGAGLTLAAGSLYMTTVGAHEIATEDVKPSEVIGLAEIIGGTAAGSTYLLAEPLRRRVNSFVKDSPINVPSSATPTEPIERENE